MNEAEIRFIDLFSGIGGFRLGLERANEERGILRQQNMLGHGADINECLEHRREASSGDIAQESDRGYRCVWSCDNNKYANQIYIKQFGEANHHSGDIEGVDSTTIPDFDLLCSGFPCQSFSVAGKRKGFEDTRGTLFFEICRIAEAKRPPLLLLENVRGFLSHDKGLTFQIILESLEELGYWAEWQVLNSKHFGVPQNRQRVFIIGHLRGAGGREIFPIGKADGMAQGEDSGKGEQVDTDKHGQRTVVGVTLVNTSRYNQGVRRTPLKQDESSFALNAAGDQGVAISFTNPHNPDEERGVNISNVSRAVKPPYGNQQPLILADRTRSYADLGRNLESPKEITNALSSVQKDNLLLENFRIRRLTPVECERLQGFPDGWTEYGIVCGEVEFDEGTDDQIIETFDKPTLVKISDTQRYKCLGNAVTVNVIEFLGRRIREALP